MKFTKIFKIVVPALVGCLSLMACATTPELLAKSAAVPANVDLSGLWKLQRGPGSEPIPAIVSDTRIRIPPTGSQQRIEKRPSRRSSGNSVQVFLETGELLKVSQTREGLFISFDRAVVEEYTFGENRVVSVGPIEAQRVSGWQGRNFVVETLDGQGALLNESWHIDAETDVLVRSISVTKRGKEQFSARQQFERT